MYGQVNHGNALVSSYQFSVFTTLSIFVKTKQRKSLIIRELGQ